MKYNAVEQAIVIKMRRAQKRWFTTNELADEIHVAWETAEKALQSLFEKGYLVKGKKKDRNYWRLY